MTHTAAIDWNRTGTQIVTATSDGAAHIWDASNGQMIHELVGHTRSIVSVSWNQASNQIATSSRDNTIRVWDAITGDLIDTLVNDTYTDTVVWSPDGTKLAANPGQIKIWDAVTFEEIGEIEVGGSITWNPTSTLIATESANRGSTWDITTGMLVTQLVDPGDFVIYDIAWHPTQNIILGVGNAGQIWIWDASSGDIINRIDSTVAAATSVDWSPDGSEFAVTTPFGFVLVFEQKESVTIP